MAGERILVVDDNAANLKLVAYLLSSKGYDVRGAADGPEALAAVAEFRPRLVLMDLQLPGMHGLDVTRRLKADPDTRAILVVALTAYAMVGDREKAAEAGCDGYVTKPIDTRALPELVAKMLG